MFCKTMTTTWITFWVYYIIYWFYCMNKKMLNSCQIHHKCIHHFTLIHTLSVGDSFFHFQNKTVLQRKQILIFSALSSNTGFVTIYYYKSEHNTNCIIVQKYICKYDLRSYFFKEIRLTSKKYLLTDAIKGSLPTIFSTIGI